MVIVLDIVAAIGFSWREGRPLTTRENLRKWTALHRGAAGPAVDGAAWVAGLAGAALTRYGAELDHRRITGTAVAAGFAVALQVTIGHAVHLYRGRHPYASREEVRALAVTVGTAATILLAAGLLLRQQPVPTIVPLAGAAIALVLMLAARYAHGLPRQRRHRP